MSDPFRGLGEPFTQITRELAFPSPGGQYASVDDLLQVNDLTWVDITVKRWHANGKPLNLRVRALTFDEQEKIDRGSLIKIDDRIVKSEARFAALTLRYCCMLPQLNDAQSRQMTAHNPEIIGAIVKLVWSVLSILDQEAIDAMVESAIPDPQQSLADPQPHDDGTDESSDVFPVGESFTLERARAADMAET